MPRNLRDRSRDLNGHRWCDDNYDIKEELTANNGGVMPFTPAFTTSAFEGNHEWSEQNPPDILFYLTPPTPEYAAYEPQYVLDENCQAVMSPRKQTQELRNIPILPDRISLSVPGWMMVAWRRIDPRINLQDIIDRMTTDLGVAQKFTAKTATVPSKNSLQNHCNRNCLKPLKHYNAYARRNEPHRAEVEAVEGLSLNNIRFNTTLNCHPKFKDRLVKVKFARKQGDGKMYVEELKVTKENLAETTYPVDHFLFDGYNPIVTESMEKALETLFVVQERALRHNMQASDWRKLSRTCLPSTWFDRTREKSSANKTYDGGCRVCSWAGTEHDGEDQVDSSPRTPQNSHLQLIDSEIEERIQKSDYTAAEYWISDGDDYEEKSGTSLGPGNTNSALQKREMLLHETAMSPTPTERKRKARDHTGNIVKHCTPAEDGYGRSEKKHKIHARKIDDLDVMNQYPLYDAGIHETQIAGITDPFYTPSRVTAQVDPLRNQDFSQGLRLGEFSIVTDPTIGVSPASSLEGPEQRFQRSLEQLAHGEDGVSQQIEDYEEYEQAWSSPQGTMYDYGQAWSSSQAPMYNYVTPFVDDIAFAMNQEIASLGTVTTPMLDWSQNLNLNYNQALGAQASAAGIG